MKRLLILICTMMAVAGCIIEDKFREEIDELYSQIDDLRESDNKITSRIDSLSSSLTKIQTIVYALQQGIYIKSVLPLEESGERKGYLITFSNGNNISIYDGLDGQDGYTPELGVQVDDDGAYYWTKDGEFLLDAKGNKVRADGALPIFDIRDGLWYISFDNGVTWKELGQAVGDDGQPGESGDRFFKNVTYIPGNNVVTFTLSDGTEISVPCYQAISISFNAYDNITGIMAGETIKVAYTLSYGNENTVVTASSDGNYIVNVKKESNTSGIIFITCPGLYMDGHVNVMAYDGIGYASIAVITFYEKKMTFGTGLNYKISAQGGTISIPLNYNFDYYVDVDNNAKSWIEMVQTKVTSESGIITFKVLKNDGDERVGEIYIFPENTTGEPYAVITVKQEAAYFNIDKSSFVFSSKGQTFGSTIISSREIEFRMPNKASEWLTPELDRIAEDLYSFSLTASTNYSNEKRYATIEVVSKSTGNQLGLIKVIQLSSNGDNEMDMVFKVRVNVSNDFTAYLPIINDDHNNDFVVDWGDGNYESVDGSDYGNNLLFHKYSDISENGKTFIVRISGHLPRLYYSHVPEGYRSCITEVLQWGHTGLTNMDNAFSGATSLEKLPADETLAFSDVNSFYSAFANCPRLTDISAHLFDYASRANDFDNLFNNCESLKTIPAGLFDHCVEAHSFSSVFRDCKSIETIPDRLFSNCRKVVYFNDSFSNCSKLKNVPANIFRNCTNVQSFSYTFSSCHQLRSITKDLFKDNYMAQSFDGCFLSSDLTDIPAGLFDNCPLATNFSYTFYNNMNLRSIPANLFDNNVKITDFSYCFAYCYNIKEESPYTMINGKKVHLYERSIYPDFFVTPANTSYCFINDYNLSDYNNIPSSWINNY